MLAQELQRLDHVALQYVKDKPGRMEYQALKLVRRMVGRFAAKDTASHELMTLGIHVLASKA